MHLRVLLCESEIIRGFETQRVNNESYCHKQRLKADCILSIDAFIQHTDRVAINLYQQSPAASLNLILLVNVPESIITQAPTVAQWLLDL